MTPLQWALLIFGVGIVAWLLYSGWRDKKALEDSRRKPEESPRPRFGQDWPAGGAGAGGGEGGKAPFDEFGVSKPRRRTPEIAPAAPSRAPGKIIAFYIAEHEGTTILGPKIHDALESRGLKFGAKKIYHRTHGGQPVFSVASLTKPGTLDPSEADGFSTPGLSVFMQLPVAIPAVAAFEDMLGIAKSLARDLNAELFDTEQQALLTPERERELHAQVQEWARQHTGG